MPQFDVHRNTGARRADVPFLVVVQSRRFDAYRRRVVIPLVTRSALPAIEPNLNPVFTIEGREVVLHPLDINALRKEQLGEQVGSLATQGDLIINAIDRVISRGFG
jgi:toxin CcdB